VIKVSDLNRIWILKLFSDLDMDFEMKYRIGFGFEKPKSVHLCCKGDR